MAKFEEIIQQLAGADTIEMGDVVQSLWSGYGVIQKVKLIQPNQPAVNAVVKHVDLSQARLNRRGWGSDHSHKRKVRSYQIETEFYVAFASRCDDRCQVPRLIAAHKKDSDDGYVLILQDLDAAGLDHRKSRIDTPDIHVCLTWLAEFHATFMHDPGAELWPIGTYWHLATRPEEFAAMPAGPLKRAAAAIDRRLNRAEYQTLVHGDAKLANFCFASPGWQQVAAVDFQYVGRGCGVKDVAYFFSSCLSDQQAAARQDELLDFYFQRLKSALASKKSALDVAALESEWRELYAFAWADFCRFLVGWSPGHWKLNRYSDRVTQSVLKKLDVSNP